MKKSVWIFLFAVLLPSVVLGWLALRSAEEQQIVFERRTAELYQKETEALAASVRETVEAERRVFGETVRRLLAKGDAEALARDFTNTLAGAWTVKAVGFAISRDGKLVSPTVAMAAKQPELQRFLVGNGSFLMSCEPALVYSLSADNLARGKNDYGRMRQSGNLAANGGSLSNAGNQAGQSLAFSEKDGAPKIFAPVEAQKKTAVPEMATQQPGADKKDNSELRRKESAPAAPAPMPAGTPNDPAGTVLASSYARPGDLQRKDEAPLAGKPASPAAPQIAPDAAGAAAGHARGIELAKAATPFDAARMPAAKRIADAPAPAKPQPQLLPSEDRPSAEPVSEKIKPAPTVQKQGATELGVDALQMKSAAGAAAGEPVAAVANGAMASVSGGALILNSTQNRLVEPQQLLGQQGAAVSAIVPETAEFRSLTEGNDDGVVARFAQDKLNLIFWLRPPEAPEMIFGCLVEAGHFSEVWKDVIERHRPSPRSGLRSSEAQPEFALALLDDRGKPVATQPADAAARDWKHPFVASEIGELLPHWEAALYLASPTALAESARGLWRTLAFTIAGAVALIAFGGWLVVADARRQLALAQQKTDFVSNVSHELKTPLTSIRMFAELMHDRPQPAEKQGQYLRIITVEAERLTRLINNVLDFAKIGRKQKRVEKKPLDLHSLVARVWESQELHLREAHFTTRWEAAPGPYPVLGDDDALAQVLVNLLSNAEKYSTDRKDVELHSWLDEAHVNIAVLDRGMGVPNGDDKKIFEAFYRAHDSLASGIQGSGLGLTLAQRIAREHGGTIQFERREGGGCRFTLRVPLAKAQGSEVRSQGSEKSWSPDS